MMKGIGSRKFVVYLALTLLYAACIFYLSSQSQLPHGASVMEQYLQRIISTVGARYFYAFKFIIIHFDKLEHFIVFFVFGILLRLTASHSRYSPIRANAMLVTLLVGIGYGALDEVHQMLVPHRSPSIYDFVADASGIIAAQIFIALVVWAYARLQNSRNRQEDRDCSECDAEEREVHTLSESDQEIHCDVAGDEGCDEHDEDVDRLYL